MNSRYKKAYIKSVMLCLLPAIMTVAVNILCLCIRTDENHNLMFWLNVSTDWICGVYLVFVICCRVLPRRQLYKLSCRSKETVNGVIDKIDDRPMRYEKLNCLPVFVGDRQFFAPEEIQLPTPGTAVSLTVASNVIMEVAL